MAQCAAQWAEQPAGFTASYVRPYLYIFLSQQVHDGEGALKHISWGQESKRVWQQ